MEQLIEAFGVDWKLLIAQAVNFGIVLGALWYFLYKPVLATLAKRQAVVAQGVQDAAEAAAKLAAAEGEARVRIQQADTEATTIVHGARQSAQAQKAALLKEAEDRAERILTDAELRAAETAERARRESEQEIARLAILASEKIIRSKHD